MRPAGFRRLDSSAFTIDFRIGSTGSDWPGRGPSASESESRRACNRGLAGINCDDPSVNALDKHYAKKDDPVGRHWSGKHKQVVWGINLITIVWTDGHRVVPCDYARIIRARSTRNCGRDDGSGKATGPSLTARLMRPSGLAFGQDDHRVISRVVGLRQEIQGEWASESDSDFVGLAEANGDGRNPTEFRRSPRKGPSAVDPESAGDPRRSRPRSN